MLINEMVAADVELFKKELLEENGFEVVRQGVRSLRTVFGSLRLVFGLAG
jgi:hypothetical protein